VKHKNNDVPMSVPADTGLDAARSGAIRHAPAANND